MADEKSDDVGMDGEEDGSLASGSEAADGEPSATSVRQADPSQSSIPQQGQSQAEASVPEKSQTSVPEKSQTSLPEKSQTSVPEKSETAIPEKSATAIPEKSETAIPEKSETVIPEKSETVIPEKSETVLAEKSQTIVPDKSQISMTEKSQTSVPEKSHTSVPDKAQMDGKSQTAINEKSQISLYQAEESQASIKLAEKSHVTLVDVEMEELPDLEGALSELGDGAEDLVQEEEVQPEPEEPRYIEPLGVATEETLVQHELKPWILDKLFHEGKMGRYGLANGGEFKFEEGGSLMYEDHKWQLDKLYRQVPEDMSMGKVRLKPDELLYEEEKWVLGKMFRELREEDYGYMPTAENQESLLDLCDAIEVAQAQFPPEPPACRPPPSMSVQSLVNVNCSSGGEQTCLSKVMSPTGKVFEFSYAGIMAVSVDSTSQMSPLNSGGAVMPRPITPFDSAPPLETSLKPTQNILSNTSRYQDVDICESNGSRLSTKAAPSQAVDNCCGNQLTVANSQVAQAPTGCPSKKTNAGDRVCKNKLRCESHIQAVCDAARKAMAIYDTVTGCDNFPCNEGDRPEKELDNIEDGVWSWLYQLIFKLTPVDANQNPLVTIPEEPAVDENQPCDDT